MTETIVPNDGRESGESVWFRLEAGDSQPVVNLYRGLESQGCTAAAEGLLSDLANRIVDASARREPGIRSDRFIEATELAIRECLRNDPDAIARHMHAALRARTSDVRDLFRFRLGHMFLLTTFCAVAVSFVGNLTAIAVIYCCVLVLVLPLYASSLYRAYSGDVRSAKNALRTGVTILLVFLLAMTRADIRDFYPVLFWGIPPALVFAAAYVEKMGRNRLISLSAGRASSE